MSGFQGRTVHGKYDAFGAVSFQKSVHYTLNQEAFSGCAERKQACLKRGVKINGKLFFVLCQRIHRRVLGKNVFHDQLLHNHRFIDLFDLRLGVYKAIRVFIGRIDGKCHCGRLCLGGSFRLV